MQRLSGAEVVEARALVLSQGLAFVTTYDDLVGVYDQGELVGVGAREGAVLQTIAIAPAHQGGAVLGELVTELVRLGHEAGHDALLVFTKPEAAPSFEQLGFELLASGGRAALLEVGGGLARWLDAQRPLVRAGANGAVVMNCNPFTLGHRWLVEQAARRVDTLYVFVVREERSAFPFEVRLRLVLDGTRDLPNVRVLHTSRYAVSAATFPSYFLKQDDPVSAIQMELDLRLFALRIAPFFHVERRFFGSEPTCATTRAYNAAMQRILPACGIAAVELPRVEAGGAPVSASRVRAQIVAGDLAAVAPLVPFSTLDFLRSPAGEALQERVREREGRH